MRSIITALVLVVAACGQASVGGEAQAQALARAAAATPTDARLAGLYTQSCKTCHAVADSGAPLALDRSAWDPRWAKGEDELLMSTIEGLNGMPPGGLCFACSREDYAALIAFMAGRERR